MKKRLVGPILMILGAGVLAFSLLDYRPTYDAALLILTEHLAQAQGIQYDTQAKLGVAMGAMLLLGGFLLYRERG